jgi:myxalamid-type nonribosomal peptide synthetase MxaA
MSRERSAYNDKLGSLSEGKAKLLEILLERDSRRVQEIRSGPHDDGAPTVLPASWAQQRLWFIDQLEGAGAAYNVAIVAQLSGALCREALEDALDAMVRRHEILRTVFTEVEGEPRQLVKTEGRCALQVFDLSEHGAVEREAQIATHKRLEALERFDLRNGPLIRVRLLRTGALHHVLLITMHHIVADGWSMGILIREFAALYRAQRNGQPDPLEPLSLQYADYVRWHRRWLQGPMLERQLAYWAERLKNTPTELELPLDRARPVVRSYRGDNVPLVLDQDLCAQVNALARRHGMTLFMVLYAAWAILLSRLSGQEDVVVGTPIANRRRPELETLIGFFVNTLVLRVRASSELSVRDFLEHVRQTTLSAYDHQDVPFEQIVELVRPPRGLNLHPVFQVMFALQNAPQAEWELPELRVTWQGALSETAKFDLLLVLEERGREIVGHLNYDVDIFDASTMQRWAAYFMTLLQAMSSCDEQCSSIGRLDIMPSSERTLVVQLFNETRTAFPHRPIQELFEEQVTRTPQAIAALYEGQSLTYAELDRQASALRRRLCRHGVKSGDYVPVVMSRSLVMLVAQLAVLKSGGVYVPVDPELPIERQLFIARDCGARVIVADKARAGAFAQLDASWIDCSQSDTASYLSDEPAGSSATSTGSPPAYVMYTSGSTGVPKGVVVPHHAVIRLAINNGFARIDAADCFIHHSNPAFDASTFEIWGALLNGARVLIVSPSIVLDPCRFSAELIRHGATILYMSVGLFNQYAETMAELFTGLRYLIVGGDSLEPGAIRRVLHNYAPQHLLNGYGPTECTTFSTTHLIRAVAPDTKSIPIGRPMANARAYILDRLGQVVPIGVIGELHIGGAGVANGYLNRPELTLERFIPDPFEPDGTARLYKTGDLCCWRPDGVIEYHGRNDRQVKIRGFRIELGEIEAQLTRYEGIGEAVILARQDGPGDKRLVAYVTASDPEHPPATEELRAHLAKSLPGYMIPNAVVLMAQIPLNSSGKVDRQSLPSPELSAYATGEYESPQGEIEEKVAAIWRQLLQIERIGRYDNFFDMGGHSLLVLKALSRVNQSFKSALHVKDVYTSPTVRELALRIQGAAIEPELVNLIREARLADDMVTIAVTRPASHRNALVTGGTGFVGRFLVAELLQRSSATIYCLVRAASREQAEARLKHTLVTWNLWQDEFEKRIVALPGDLRKPRLGIDHATYEFLCGRIDSIYHCATSMNHLETYWMAKAANVDGARELLRLAMQRRPKLINCVSTVSVFSAMRNTARTVHEHSPIDYEVHSSANGYAASKWVSEKIFMGASERGIPCNIFRLGLVWADAHRGRYDDLQRGYRMLKSSLLCGLGIKDYRYDMSPTPVDYVARSVAFLADRHSCGGGVFHICASGQMSRGLFEHCNEAVGTSLELVPLYDWIQAMRQLHETGNSLPVVPLIDYAFGMSEESFREHQRRAQAERINFDCARTHGELAEGGIVIPSLDDRLIRLCLEDMFVRDAQLRGQAKSGSGRILAASEA